MMARTTPPTRADFHAELVIPTRWMDNDAYGHINNAIYYSWFDTVVNQWLIKEGLLDPARGEIVGLVVESGCNYHRSARFPEPVTAMLRVGYLGTSSVRYELGIFTASEDSAAAHGHFVHVYVDRNTWRPLPLPENWRHTLSRLMR